MMFQDLGIGDWFKFAPCGSCSYKKVGVNTYVYPLTWRVHTVDVDKEVMRSYDKKNQE